MTFTQKAVEAAARAIAETRGAIWTRPDHTVSASFDHDAAVAALSAALAVDGLALVPVVLTGNMAAAMECEFSTEAQWAAALAAADNEEHRTP
jgi:hypothetical protein